MALALALSVKPGVNLQRCTGDLMDSVLVLLHVQLSASDK